MADNPLPTSAGGSTSRSPLGRSPRFLQRRLPESLCVRCMEERLLNAKRHPGQRRRAYRPGCRPPKSSLIGKLDAIRLERQS